jgi:hypothetical protein
MYTIVMIQYRYKIMVLSTDGVNAQLSWLLTIYMYISGWKLPRKYVVSASVGGYNVDTCRYTWNIDRSTAQTRGCKRFKINDDGVSTLKQACSGRYSGMLTVSSLRFEHAQNRSAPFLTIFSIASEILNGLGRYRAVIHSKFGVKPRIFNNTGLCLEDQ